MAQRTWRGGLFNLPSGTQPTAQVWSATVNSSTNGQTFQIILTDEVGNTATVSYTASSDTTTSIATNLTAKLVASQDPRFQNVTATNPSNGVITLTAKNAGVPFYAATGGTGAWTGAGNTTASLGGNDWNTAANWAENAVPVGGDNVYLTGNTGIYYGLQTGLALGGFNAMPGSNTPVGGPGEYLTFTCTGLYWAGTGMAFINIGSSNISPRILTTSSATGLSSGLYLLGSNITTLQIDGGSVDLAGTPGQTTTIGTLQMTATAGRVRLGSGVTLTTLNEDAGVAELGCAATNVTVEGGTLTTVGSGAVTTMNNNGGTIICNSTGTIGTLNANQGTTDFTASQAARTVTTATIAPRAVVKADPAVVTFTNKIGMLSGTGPITLTAS